MASDEKLLFALSLLKEDDCGNSFYASNAILVSVDIQPPIYDKWLKVYCIGLLWYSQLLGH